jgi:carbon monoxide dehydrogenase subunit G
MELVGEVAIPAPRERVWGALNDLAVLQACIRGCEELVEESATVRKARVMVKVGPVRARFTGRMTLTEVEAPRRCVMGFEGSGGAAGMASGRAQVELHEDAGATRLTYAVKAAVGGKLGQIGGRMIDASAKQLADQFFEALRAHVAAPAPGIAAAQPVVQASGVQASPPPLAAVAPAVPAPASAEAPRVLWFLLGVASTALGAWIGKVLF